MILSESEKKEIRKMYELLNEVKDKEYRKKLIFEQSFSPSPEQKNIINQLITNESEKAKNHFSNHFSKQETTNKFKNKNNIEKIKKYIPTIRYKPYYKKDRTKGYVQDNNSNVINLNIYNMFNIKGNNVTVKGNSLYNTIIHEMSHLIDFKLRKLGEITIQSTTGFYRPTSGDDGYVENDYETYARIQRMREVLKLSPNANGSQIKNKILELIKSKKMILPNNIKTDQLKSSVNLAFSHINNSKGALHTLWTFYTPMKINGVQHHDIAALFAKFSFRTNIGGKKYIILDIEKISKVNISTVDNSTPDSSSNLA